MKGPAVGAPNAAVYNSGLPSLRLLLADEYAERDWDVSVIGDGLYFAGSSMIEFWSSPSLYC